VSKKFHLISFKTWPWVQRAVIVLRAKGIDFEVTHITADDKPDWFLEISPHGKVPVLWVGDDILFESNAIAEFLDDTVEPRLHPEDPVKRARNRAWTDFTPDFAKALGAVNYAKSRDTQNKAKEDARRALTRLEEALKQERGNEGPYFNGGKLCIVDAAHAPFFMRFTLVEKLCKTGLIKEYPSVERWRQALVDNDIIKGSVVSDFSTVFEANLHKRDAYAATLLKEVEAAE